MCVTVLFFYFYLICRSMRVDCAHPGFLPLPPVCQHIVLFHLYVAMSCSCSPNGSFSFQKHLLLQSPMLKSQVGKARMLLLS